MIFNLIKKSIEEKLSCELTSLLWDEAGQFFEVSISRKSKVKLSKHELESYITHYQLKHETKTTKEERTEANSD
jgi:hypothetical protein